MNTKVGKNEAGIPFIREFLHILKAGSLNIAWKNSKAFFLGYDPDCLTVEYPVNIQLSLNKTCNLNCIFCVRQTNRSREQLAAENNLVMPIDFLEKNLTLFKSADYVNISADGEPLLHPEANKIFTLLGGAGHKPNIIFVTNGVLFNEELIEIIVKSQIKEIHFSIDSLIPKTLKFIRPGVELDTLITSIERINLSKKKNKSAFPRLVLRPTFISKTIGELPMMLDFCHKYGFSAILVQQMQIYKKELTKYSLVHCKKLTKKIINETVKKGEQLDIPVVLDPIIEGLEKQGTESIDNALAKVDKPVPSVKDMKVKNLREKCSFPWEYMLIQTNGDIYPCCHSEYLLGNLNNESWENIWNGPKAKELRKKFMRDILPKECVNQPCGLGNSE